MNRLDISVAASNALLDVAGWFEDHGHPTAYRRLVAFRGRFDKAMCRLLLGHPRIIYGSMCDICLDCLSIVDEHPNGRGRSDAGERSDAAIEVRRSDVLALLDEENPR